MEESVGIFEEVIRLQRAGEPCVLATVVASRGSSPRKAGARMVIRPDGSSRGTVGGGGLEMQVVAAALAALATGEPPHLLEVNLVEEFGHVCGGDVTVYLEPLPAAPSLIICGAGHVGEALTTVAAFAGFRVTVLDQRPAFVAADRLPAAAERHCGDYTDLLGELPVNAATSIVIATPGFQTDFAAARAALATPAGFIGLIGSRRKRETLFTTLAEEGYGPEARERLAIPVGLPIGGETPREIAVSIVAQLIERRNQHVAQGRSPGAGCRAVPADGMLQAAPAVP
jgi:xanthine dehydrogenase accessory factor